MTVKSSSVGLFTIPAAPSIGVTVASPASANLYTVAYVALASSSLLSSAAFLTRVSASVQSSLIPRYLNVQIATGASGSESVVGQIQLNGNPQVTAGGVVSASADIWPPIPVAATTRIAAKTADNLVTSVSWDVSLQAITQSNVVAEGSIAETVNVTQIAGATVNTASAQLGVNVVSIADNAITDTAINANAITDAKVASDVTIASVTGAVGSVTGAVGSVTGAVGSVTGAVGSVAAGGITAASFAANAITAAKLDPDVTTELQAGLATSSAVSTLQTSVDDLPTSAELATALGTADDAVLAQIALVKAKTDSLTFTVANKVDANTKSINDVTVTGVGTAGDPWGP
jgi:hypothetical protein